MHSADQQARRQNSLQAPALRRRTRRRLVHISGRRAGGDARVRRRNRLACSGLNRPSIGKILASCPTRGSSVAALVRGDAIAAHQSRDPNSYFVVELRDVATYSPAHGHQAPSVRADLRALAAMTAIVAFELLTSYAEDTEQGMWPLLNQLEHSLPTILTSCFRIV